MAAVRALGTWLHWHVLQLVKLQLVLLLLHVHGSTCLSEEDAESIVNEADSLGGQLPIFVKHPQTTIAKAGSNVSFSCEVQPENIAVTWILDNQTLENGSNVLFGKVVLEGDSGRTLHVLDFVNSAKGTLRCLAAASSGVVASKGAALIKARLRAFRKMEDVVISVAMGNTVSIPCTPPYSVPPAVCVFEVNGTVIDRSNERYHLLPHGELQIANVQLTDGGVYRCIATNEVTKQKVVASNVVKLRIFVAADGQQPVAVKYPEKVTVAEGERATLPCVMNGFPAPAITWEKYGSDWLPQNRTQRLLGNLYLLQTKETDTGTYLCRAENDASGRPETAVTMLDVLVLPRIVKPPANQLAEEGASASFQCTVRRGAETASLSWLHNGHPVLGAAAGNGRVLVASDVDDGSVSSTVTIESVQRRHEGVYQCVANNSAGEETAYARLLVRSAAWQRQAALGGRGNVDMSGFAPVSSAASVAVAEDTHGVKSSPPSVKQSSSSGAVIQWTISDVGRVAISVRIDMRNQSLLWQTLASDLPANTTRLELNGLQRGVAYKFRVMVELANHQYVISPDSAKFKILTSRQPAGTPFNASAKISDQPRLAHKKQRLSAATTAVPRLSRLPTADAPKSNGETAIVPPPKPTVKLIGETSVLVQWSRPFQGMPISFYKIQYKDIGWTRGTHWVTVDSLVSASVTQHEVSGLRPGGTYKFRLAAVYANNDNRMSETTERVQLGSSGLPSRGGGVGGRRIPPQLVPRLTELLSQVSDQMYLRWEYLIDPAPIDGFVVQYKPDEPSPRVWLESRVAGYDSREWVLRGLIANTSYQVCVRSENSAGRSQCSNTLKRTTKVDDVDASAAIDEVYKLISQTHRGPASVANESRERGLGGLRDSDEDYQPATRGRSSQQPDELLYLVVGVVAGAMLLTLTAFVAICVHRQMQQRRHQGKLTCEPGSTAETCHRRFKDASTLIFTDAWLQKATVSGRNSATLALSTSLLAADKALNVSGDALPCSTQCSGKHVLAQCDNEPPSRLSICVNPLDQMDEDGLREHSSISLDNDNSGTVDSPSFGFSSLVTRRNACNNQLGAATPCVETGDHVDTEDSLGPAVKVGTSGDDISVRTQSLNSASEKEFKSALIEPHDNRCQDVDCALAKPVDVTPLSSPPLSTKLSTFGVTPVRICQECSPEQDSSSAPSDSPKLQRIRPPSPPLPLSLSSDCRKKKRQKQISNGIGRHYGECLPAAAVKAKQDCLDARPFG